MVQCVVYVAEFFDLFHRGHVELFRKTRGLGDKLVVPSNACIFWNVTSGRLFFGTGQTEIVTACRFVDEAFLIDDYDNWDPILKYGAKKIVHGDDSTGASYLEQLRLTKDLIDRHGIEMVYAVLGGDQHVATIANVADRSVGAIDSSTAHDSTLATESVREGSVDL